MRLHGRLNGVSIAEINFWSTVKVDSLTFKVENITIPSFDPSLSWGRQRSAVAVDLVSGLTFEIQVSGFSPVSLTPFSSQYFFIVNKKFVLLMTCVCAHGNNNCVSSAICYRVYLYSTEKRIFSAHGALVARALLRAGARDF